MTFTEKGLEQDIAKDWTIQTFTPEFNTKLENYFAGYKKFYQEAYNRAVNAKDAEVLKNEKAGGYSLNDHKNRYFNESLSDLVKNVSEKDRIIEYEGALYQQINPIFLDPLPASSLDYRAHFFAPRKNLFGSMINTYLFNNLVIWLMTIILYATLYFEVLRKLINSFAGLPVTVPLPKADQTKK
ncbi:MAG: hypothetical protein QM762_26700 [Chryseolinea sp.]